MVEILKFFLYGYIPIRAIALMIFLFSFFDSGISDRKQECCALYLTVSFIGITSGLISVFVFLLLAYLCKS